MKWTYIDEFVKMPTDWTEATATIDPDDPNMVHFSIPAPLCVNIFSPVPIPAILDAGDE